MLLWPLSLAVAVSGQALRDVQSLPGKSPTTCSCFTNSPAVNLVQASAAVMGPQRQPAGAAPLQVQRNRSNNATKMLMDRDESASTNGMALAGMIAFGAVLFLVCLIVLLDPIGYSDDKPRAPGPGRPTRQAAPRDMGPSLRNMPVTAKPRFPASGGPSPIAADLSANQNRLSTIPSSQRVSRENTAFGNPGGEAQMSRQPSGSSQAPSRQSFQASPTSRLSEAVGLNSGPVPRPPPAMCPSLVLPHCESWFAVSFDKLMSNASFDMIGLSGRPLLRANVKNPRGPGDVRAVGIAMLGKSTSILGSCQTLPPGSAPDGTLELRGSREAFFGTLAPSTPGCYSLTCNEQLALTIAFDTQVGQLLVSAHDGTVIGSARRRLDSEFFSSSEHLEVRVGPSIDSILVLCCVLGVLLFGATISRPKLGT